MSLAKQVRVAPSILSADFGRLADEATRATRHTDILHLDIMDGHFVPNISFGPLVVAALRRTTRAFLDVHLMIEPPEPYLEAFAQAGADRLTVHVEATRHLHRALGRVREAGVRAGVALNPATPAAAVQHVLHLVDLVLVMTVNPGFGGQSFLWEVLPKVEEVAAMVEPLPHPVEVEVDGGIDRQTAGPVARAGATLLVAGSSVFRQADPGEEAAVLARLGEEGRRERERSPGTKISHV